jgi:hypothetical protein
VASQSAADFARLVAEHDKRIAALEAGGRTAQLAHSSIENGYINAYDNDGRLRQVLGRQPDGTWGASHHNAPPPDPPSAPQLTPGMSSLIVTWDGTQADGAPYSVDFDHVNVYILDEDNPDFAVASGTLAGEISQLETKYPLAPLDSATVYAVRFTAVNTSGAESDAGPGATAQPNQVVAQDLLDGIVDTVNLADDAVKRAKIDAAAVGETEIADESVSTPKLVAAAVEAAKIAAGAVLAEKIAADAVTAEKIEALAVVAGKIAANAVTAGTIEAGAVTADKLAAMLVLASTLIAGTENGARVELDSDGLRKYDSSGNVLVEMTGDDVHVEGVLTTGAFKRGGSGIGIGGDTRDNIGIQDWRGDSTLFMGQVYSGGAPTANAMIFNAAGANHGVSGAPVNMLKIVSSTESASDPLGLFLTMPDGTERLRFGDIDNDLVRVHRHDGSDVYIGDLADVGASGSSSQNGMLISDESEQTNFVVSEQSLYWKSTYGAPGDSGTQHITLDPDGGDAAIYGGSNAKLQLNADGSALVGGNNNGYLQFESNGAAHFYGNGLEGLSVYNSLCQSQAIYGRTYSFGGNVCISGSGTLGRSTSSRRYKENIAAARDLPNVLDVQPRTWTDKAERERQDAQDPNDECLPPDAELPRHYGAIAEELADLGLTELLQYDEQGRPDAISYDRIGVALIPIVRQLSERVAELEVRLAGVTTS